MIFRFSTAALAILFTTPAYADDRCSDILSRGTFQTAEFRENDSFKQIMWSRFLRSDYQSAKKDTKAGFGIPLGDFVVGADASEEGYKAKQSSVKSEKFSDITANREIDVALSSGDPEIVKAWSTCMTERGGLSARFEVISATKAILLLRYYPQHSNTTEKIIGVATPSGVTFDDPGKCFRKGAKIKLNYTCRIIVSAPNARTTVNVVVSGVESSASAWLPARITPVKEVLNYKFSDEDSLRQSMGKVVNDPSRTVNMPDHLLKEGWLFVPSSARASIINHYINKASCTDPAISATSLTTTYSYHFYAPNRNKGGKDGWADCSITPTVMMWRERWVSTDDVTPNPVSIN